MWKLKLKLEGQDKWHTVFGMGMAFSGFHILDQAASFIVKNLDNYVATQFGKNAEVLEVAITFEDKVK
jgi:hypothetical protein